MIKMVSANLKDYTNWMEGDSKMGSSKHSKEVTAVIQVVDMMA